MFYCECSYFGISKMLLSFYRYIIIVGSTDQMEFNMIFKQSKKYHTVAKLCVGSQWKSQGWAKRVPLLFLSFCLGSKDAGCIVGTFFTCCARNCMRLCASPWRSGSWLGITTFIEHRALAFPNEILFADAWPLTSFIAVLKASQNTNVNILCWFLNTRQQFLEVVGVGPQSILR